MKGILTREQKKKQMEEGIKQKKMMHSGHRSTYVSCYIQIQVY